MGLIIGHILRVVVASCLTACLTVIAEVIVVGAYGPGATRRGPEAFWALLPVIAYLVSVAAGALWIGTRLAPGWLWGMLVAAMQPVILFVVAVRTSDQQLRGLRQHISTFSLSIYLVLVVSLILLLGSGALGGWLGEVLHRWRGSHITSAANPTS